MQTETKPDIFEIMASTPEEATELLWEELKKKRPDLQLIEDIITYTLVNVNLQNEWGWAALMRAADMGNEKVVELLLKHPGIDVNVQDNDGRTALMLAEGKTECIELLLNHPGIDVNVQNKWGYTALMFVANRGKENPVELLLNHPGIDVNVRDERGRTAWNFANNSIRQKFPKLNPNS